MLVRGVVIKRFSFSAPASQILGLTGLASVSLWKEEVCLLVVRSSASIGPGI